MTEWAGWVRRIAEAGPGDIDDVVDEAADAALGRAPGPAAAPALCLALRSALSESSKRSAATALAWSAGPQDTDAVDALDEAYRNVREDPSLGPAILGALGLLALRSPSARASAVGFLLRLKLTDLRYLLVAGAKVIGILCDQADDQALREKLAQLGGSTDQAVAAEAHQQIGLLRVGDALLSEKEPELHGRLQKARESFAQAQSLEEVRPDASLFVGLLDMVLRFDTIKPSRDGALGEVRGLTDRVRGTVSGLGQRVFRGYGSDAAARIAGHALDIAEALERAAVEAAEATRWTNFDHSVASLAECYALIRYRPEALPGQERLGAALEAFADRILRPRMAPVLMRNVGRERFAQVVRNYQDVRGEDDILRGLIALQEATIAAEKAVKYRLSDETQEGLAALAKRANLTPDELVDEFIVVVERNEVGEWASRLGLRPQRQGSQLQPDLREDLQRALLSAFDKKGLRMMLHLRMGEQLDHIAGEGNLTDVVYEVIVWAERQGRVRELAQAAQGYVPGNPDLRAVAEQIEKEARWG